MSKKHRRHESGEAGVQHLGLRGEYAIIKSDLVRVLMLNVLYLAGVLALYYSNQKTQYLEKWFSAVFNF